MKSNTLNFDVLHNFISPVTGRVLSTPNYVLLGDRNGIATPSPIIIDIRLELIKLRKDVDSILNGEIIFPIGSLPNLTYQYLWTGDIDNRPVEIQRIILDNLPPFLIDFTNPLGPLFNYGIFNLYTGQGLIPNPLNITKPTTTLRIDKSNMANLTIGKMWIGVANPIPPITITSTPPFINITGDLNWDPRVLLPPSPVGGPAFGVPVEVGLNPGFIFIGSSDPLKLGQIEASDSLILLQDQVTSLESDVITIQGEIGTLQTEISTIQAELVLIDADLTAINTTLYTPVVGLVSVVAGLVITVGINTANIVTLFARTLDQVPVAIANVNLNNNKIINLADPSNPLDAVNLQTLQSYISGSGTVTNVSGTSGQIVVLNNTTTPVISIDPTYVGQSSIITLGTITTGTWNGSVVGLGYGGTNASLTPSNGGIVYSTASAMAILAGTPTSSCILLSGASSAPSWSTAQYPATTTINQLLYSSSADVITGLATANNSVLITGPTGVPAWTTMATNFVTSITGTVNQITASSSAGAVTLSLPTSVIITTSVTAGNLKLTTNTLQSTNTNGNVNIEPNGIGNILLTTHGSGVVGIGTISPAYLLDVWGNTRVKRLLGNDNLPSVTLGSSTIVGTSATYSIVGSEIGGVFTLNTGSGIHFLNAGIAATFTLTTPMPSSTFSVIFTAADSNLQQVYTVAISSTQFTLNIAAHSLLLVGTTYTWNYQIIGY